MLNKILIGAIVLLIAVVGYSYLSSSETNELSEATTFTDAENKQFTIQYSSSKEEATLSLSGVQHELSLTSSDSGDRYENEDGTVIFWEEGGEAVVEINGEFVFPGAMTAERRVEVLKSNKQGDPNANKYDFKAQSDVEELCNGVDDDCSGPDVQIAAPGDPIPGIGITTEQGATGEVMIEDEAAEPDQVKATDYNSTRSNRTTNN